MTTAPVSLDEMIQEVEREAERLEDVQKARVALGFANQPDPTMMRRAVVFRALQSRLVDIRARQQARAAEYDR